MKISIRRYGIVRALFLALFLAVIVFSLCKLYDISAGYAASEKSYDRLAAQYVQVASPADPEPPAPVSSMNAAEIPPESEETVETAEPDVPEKTENVPLRVSFDELRAVCGDVIGWLYCEGTPVNYPVVQSGDNDYYLRRLIDGTYNMSGSLFADYRNASDFSDYNTLIYGHNMNNDSMFGTLQDYRKQAYYEEHPVWYLLTPDASYTIELIGGYPTTSTSAGTYAFPETSEERDILVENARNNSTFRPAEAPVIGENDRIITLSTCVQEYGHTDARYVLVGVLREIKQ